MITLPRRHRMNSLAAHPRSEAQTPSNSGRSIASRFRPMITGDAKAVKMITQSVKASDD
jgi:hypothetical protein